MLRYFTAGESHGKGLTAIIEGIPSGFQIDINKINEELKLRQGGYGRGGRQKIESDRVQVLSGIRGGVTLGSPITLWIENKDYQNWEPYMNESDITEGKEVSRPRGGHADLWGGMKYNHRDLRNILERASARETAIRVAVGALCRQILEYFDISIYSSVCQIGDIKIETNYNDKTFIQNIGISSLRCGDLEATKKMEQFIDRAKENGDSVGGVIETAVFGVPAGLGSFVQWDRKLDAKLACAMMSIQSIKGVEFGLGFQAAERYGSAVHDEIFYSEEQGYYRKTNRCGGIEGGMSNGSPIMIRCAAKPIPTLYKPLQTVDIDTKEEIQAAVERSDICAVAAASIVCASVAAVTILDEFLLKFGGDTKCDIEHSYQDYQNRISHY